MQRRLLPASNPEAIRSFLDVWPRIRNIGLLDDRNAKYASQLYLQIDDVEADIYTYRCNGPTALKEIKTREVKDPDSRATADEQSDLRLSSGCPFTPVASRSSHPGPVHHRRLCCKQHAEVFSIF
ncbi:hypothetical protein TESG_05720 [Trichophyton tonsurans CBS 112818]|uniref:Uncharacterized protein n=1 Tax=Trichophyton tonsurans (strain CBS 112818) TaxID=647933 RepID=F2S442_TRIT1|nr:hypothetical protein TESG_05720 [Trichophyton tonsurans CBS 112818]